jgi:hypothetical protein
MRSKGGQGSWGAIHQLLSIILQLRILVLLPVSNLPYVAKVKNYSLMGRLLISRADYRATSARRHTHTNAYRNVSTRNLIARTHSNVGKIVRNFKRAKTGVK